MKREITIVDRGRGPQLCTSRVTVQDLLPYFQLGYTDEQIIQDVMPSLSVAEIEVARCYVEEHREEVLEEDRQIRECDVEKPAGSRGSASEGTEKAGRAIGVLSESPRRGTER